MSSRSCGLGLTSSTCRCDLGFSLPNARLFCSATPCLSLDQHDPNKKTPDREDRDGTRAYRRRFTEPTRPTRSSHRTQTRATRQAFGRTSAKLRRQHDAYYVLIAFIAFLVLTLSVSSWSAWYRRSCRSCLPCWSRLPCRCCLLASSALPGGSVFASPHSSVHVCLAQPHRAWPWTSTAQRGT